MDLGVDISSDWVLDNKGDLSLVRDEDNIGQAIVNRLNTYQPHLKVFYTNYGGFLHEYFGMRRTESTLEFLKIELDTILGQEERINSFTSNLSYADDGSVLIDLTLVINDDMVDLNLVLNNDGVIIEEEA